MSTYNHKAAITTAQLKMTLDQHKQTQQNTNLITVKSVGTDNPEYDRVKNEIAEVRFTIENAERTYKELLTIRRLMPHAIFGDQEPLFQDVSDTNSGDFVTRARQELGRVRAYLAAMEQEKQQKAHGVQEALKEKIMIMKEKFKKKESLIQAGPKFTRHFFCNFGNVLLVTALTEFTYAVFSSQNTLEIWEIPEENSSRARLVELFELNMDPLCMVMELFRERDEPSKSRPTTQHQQNRSGLNSRPRTGTNDIPDGMHSYPTQSGSDVNAQRFLFHRRDFNGLIQGSKGPAFDTDATLKQDILFSENNRPKTGSIIRQRYSFFLGASTGSGIVVEIRVTFDQANQKLMYDYVVVSKKKMSSSPIKVSLSYVDQENSRVIVVDVTKSESGQSPSNERFIQGYSQQLELLWFCPLEMLRQCATDRQQRIFSPSATLQNNRSMSMRFPDEILITAMEYDSHHKTVLVALKRGTVLRISAIRDQSEVRALTRGNRRASMALLLANDVDPNSSRGDNTQVDATSDPDFLVKVMWCLDLYSTAAQSTASHGKKESEFNAMVESRFNKLMINSLKYFVSKHTKKPQLMVASSDGVIRIFQNESLKCLAKPATLLLERDSRAEHYHLGDDIARVPPISTQAEVDMVDGETDVQLIIAYTSKSSLICYDPLDPSQSALEIQILSNRGGFQSRVSQLLAAYGQETVDRSKMQSKAPRHSMVSRSNTLTDAPSNLPGSGANFLADKYAHGRQFLKVVDDSTGLSVLFNGREWCIFSLQNLIQFYCHNNKS